MRVPFCRIHCCKNGTPKVWSKKKVSSARLGYIVSGILRLRETFVIVRSDIQAKPYASPLKWIYTENIFARSTTTTKQNRAQDEQKIVIIQDSALYCSYNALPVAHREIENYAIVPPPLFFIYTNYDLQMYCF